MRVNSHLLFVLLGEGPLIVFSCQQEGPLIVCLLRGRVTYCLSCEGNAICYLSCEGNATCCLSYDGEGLPVVCLVRWGGGPLIVCLMRGERPHVFLVKECDPVFNLQVRKGQFYVMGKWPHLCQRNNHLVLEKKVILILNSIGPERPLQLCCRVGEMPLHYLYI